MNEDIIPKIFISYSWTNDDFVVPLAERLREHGVDVVLDKWDLKEGQDKYVFMEQCVNNPEITKVLIICDKAYTEKANGRKGGVGDETAIISSEIYGNVSQEKFIPIITEHDEEGNACVPVYIKSRIYIDFTDEYLYEENYEKLLRLIYNKPSYRKPKLGKRPEWLDDESISLFEVNDLIKQIRGAKNDQRMEILTKEFLLKYIETLGEYFDEDVCTGDKIYEKFIYMKDIRDVFLEFLDVIPITNAALGDVLTDFFENAYNTLTDKDTFIPNTMSWSPGIFEINKIFLWELFICVTAFLLKKEDYKALNRLLTNTYFIKDKYSCDSEDTSDYTVFRHHSQEVEEQYKPTTENKQKFTLLGDCICNSREKKPLYTKKSLAEADLFLYQIYKALDLNTSSKFAGTNYWFPTLYVYADPYNRSGMWTRMKSKRFATKICDLVGVDSIDELKTRIEKCSSDREMTYPRSFDSAPGILAYIKPDEIGTLNEKVF